MKLEKELCIDQFISQRTSNAPFVLKCGDSVFNFNRMALDEYEIAPDINLSGKTLVVNLTSRKEGMYVESCFGTSPIKEDDLRLVNIKKVEERIWRLGCNPPEFNEMVYSAFLKSFGGGDGIHPRPLPCPYYELRLKLNKQEYGDLKELSVPGNCFPVMKINFKLKD